MQSSDVGLMMTVYAWTVMIMSLPAMLATGTNSVVLKIKAAQAMMTTRQYWVLSAF